MVDTPKGKTEVLIDAFFNFFKSNFRLGKKKTSPQRRQIKKFKRCHPRIARAILATTLIMVVGLVVVGFATPKTVTVNVTDFNETVTRSFETTSLRVDSFIENHEIDFVYGQDIIDVQLYKGIYDGMEINIKKAALIPVTADGKTINAITQPVTVKELLDKLEIKVGKHDIVEPALDHVLFKGDQLVVKRVTFKEITEDVTIDFETVYTADYGMNIGDTSLIQEGAPGKERQDFKVTYIDGVESERELLASETLFPVQHKTIAYGMYMDFSEPYWLSYSKKISNVKAVSYHFSGNPKGSYGQPCTYGTVAVDPSVIPLGTMLYIEGYGYALANDVGTSIKGNIIDVYMEYNPQCYTWGARNVNVYIVG